MASKRGTPATQTSQQAAQQRINPPSPPPNPISFKDMEELLSKQLSKLKADLREELREDMVQMEERIEKKMEEKIIDLTGKVSGFFNDFADHAGVLEDRVEEVAQKNEVTEVKVNLMEEKMEMIHNEAVMAEYRDMEFAVRIRGLKENDKENLWEEVAVAVAEVLECEPGIILGEIEKIFRVNSWVARHNNLPRDVVVYFSRKSRHNQIIQAFYQKNFQVADQKVVILKELPSRILRLRKDYQFLAQELKDKQILFRWDIPIGIIVTYAGKRYRLNTVQKARDFYSNVLRADGASSRGAEAREEGLVVDLPANGREQRITRAAHRRMEKELQESQYALVSTITTDSQPVGGARPKTKSLEDLRGKLLRWHNPKNA